VDLQFRALCNGTVDKKGLELVHCIVLLMSDELRSGQNFEVLQAYLYRLLLIYSEVIVEASSSDLSLSQSVDALRTLHSDSCKKFRSLVQSNLCVLKLMAQISSV
jgi:hypothetical protein